MSLLLIKWQASIEVPLDPEMRINWRETVVLRNLSEDNQKEVLIDLNFPQALFYCAVVNPSGIANMQ